MQDMLFLPPCSLLSDFFRQGYISEIGGELRTACFLEGQSSTTQINNYLNVPNNNIHDVNNILIL
jgi:hypothetical protein